MSYLPETSALVEYLGTWDAVNNNPTLSSNTGEVGNLYRVVSGATRNLGTGDITFKVGDYVLYNKSQNWEKLKNTPHSLSELENVAITSANVNDFLLYTSSGWTNEAFPAEIKPDHILMKKNIGLDGNWLSGDGDNEGFYFQNDGKIGLDTKNPNAKFNISGSTSGQTLFQVEGTEGVLIDINDNLSNGPIYQIYNANQTSIFNVVANEKIGILTTNPQEVLDVRGRGVFQGDIYPYTGNTYDLGKPSSYFQNLYVRNINNQEFNEIPPSEYYQLTIVTGTPNQVEWDLKSRKQLNAYFLVDSDTAPNKLDFELVLKNINNGTTGELLLKQTVNGTIRITMPSQSFIKNGDGSGVLEIYGNSGEKHILGVKLRPDGQGGFYKYWTLDESLVPL